MADKSKIEWTDATWQPITGRRGPHTAREDMMPDYFDHALYRLALWASEYHYDWLWKLIFRYRCPYPIADRSVKACIAAGKCGCDNGKLRP